MILFISVNKSEINYYDYDLIFLHEVKKRSEYREH